MLEMTTDTFKDASNETKFEYYLANANQGHIIAQYNTGYCYQVGKGTKENHQKAFEWFQKAALQNEPDAQYQVAEYYRYGVNVVTIDLQKAVQWYEKAALQNKTKAQFELGQCYENALGVDQNFEIAFKWYQTGALQGDAACQNSLGTFYFDGKGKTPVDYQKALTWIEKAAIQGDHGAECNLALYYQIGIQPIKQDYKTAFEWFQKSALQGNIHGQFHLGFCYFQGRGVAQDYKQAFDWIHKAALQGSADAQDTMGQFYQKDSLVDKDINAAIKWFKKAAMQQHFQGIDHLKEYYSVGNPAEKLAAKACEALECALLDGQKVDPNRLKLAFAETALPITTAYHIAKALDNPKLLEKLHKNFPNRVGELSAADSNMRWGYEALRTANKNTSHPQNEPYEPRLRLHV